MGQKFARSDRIAFLREHLYDSVGVVKGYMYLAHINVAIERKYVAVAVTTAQKLEGRDRGYRDDQCKRRQGAAPLALSTIPANA